LSGGSPQQYGFFSDRHRNIWHSPIKAQAR
jgi:hypothetical protein